MSVHPAAWPLALLHWLCQLALRLHSISQGQLKPQLRLQSSHRATQLSLPLYPGQLQLKLPLRPSLRSSSSSSLQCL